MPLRQSALLRASATRLPIGPTNAVSALVSAKRSAVTRTFLGFSCALRSA